MFHAMIADRLPELLTFSQEEHTPVPDGSPLTVVSWSILIQHWPCRIGFAIDRNRMRDPPLLRGKLDQPPGIVYCQADS